MQGGFDVNGAKLAYSRWFFTVLYHNSNSPFDLVSL
jgi:hypothetical protein